MKRPAIKIYLTPQLLDLVQQKAYILGLLPSQYVKFLVLKDINTRETRIILKQLLEQTVDH